MIIAILNMKGGVGKTTLTCNLGLGLSKYHNKKVLIVDVDPQFNATQYLMGVEQYLKHIKNPSKCTVNDIFIKREPISVGLGSRQKHEEPRIEPTKENCTVRILNVNETAYLDLVPSTLDLMEADILGRGIENKLKIFLDKIKDIYDIILIDCPPTISLFTISAYIASDAYVVPLKPDLLSSIGISLIGRAMKRLSDNYGKTIDYLGCIFIMTKKTILMRDVMKSLRKSSELKCFDSILSDSIKIAGTTGDYSIFDLNGTRYPDEMKAIVEEFQQRLVA